MTLSDEEKKEELIQAILDWKYRCPSYSWEYIQDHLSYLYEAKPFMDSYSNEDFKELSKKLVLEARKKLNERTDTRGISAKHERWFSVEKLHEQKYWDHFEQQMKIEKWPESRLEINKTQSEEIINNLSNPLKKDTSDTEATRKGLVYGHVQSGKTAQMSSLLAMYASCGCKMFIVFSGITNSLRDQTANRFRKDLGIDEMGGWDLLTAVSDKLGKNDVCIEGRIHGEMPVLGVFKKNPHVLRRLKDYLENTNNSNLWKGKTVLIIDDECDNASMNVEKQFDDNGKPTGKRSSINALITDILNIFDRFCYVGFTATPFANVLNEKPGKDSLYPSDFIYPLEVNEKYYSAGKLFGSMNDDPENPSPLLNEVNLIDVEEISPNYNDYSKVPESLKKAVFYFIAATACRYFRGMKNKHSSMLIHVDRKISIQDDVNIAVQEFVSEIKQKTDSFYQQIENAWESEKNKVSFETIKELFSYSDDEKEKYYIPDFRELKQYIKKTIEKLEIVVDNSSVQLEERLHYPDKPDEESSKVYIVIGGNTLSRGLTLEGLLVSYFYRTSKLYDTLLQMGRWFGYRIGYEDLPRIWTTERIARNFSLLADVEDELQEQFSGYQNGLTPCEIAPRIRTLPLLQITRKRAMQSAKAAFINYGGQRPSTLFFKRKDREWLLHNQEAVRKFLDKITLPPVYKNGNIIFNDVSIDEIRNFIVTYNISEANNACRKDLLLKYIDNAKGKEFLLRWNVAVIQNKSGREYQISSSLKVHLLSRSRIDTKIPDDEKANIKVLGQPQNILVDTNLSETDEYKPLELFIKRHKYFEDLGKPEPGLLLIYPIDKDSRPKSNQTGRLPLDACEDVIGIMLVFPKDKNIEFNTYMAIPFEKESDEGDE